MITVKLLLPLVAGCWVASSPGYAETISSAVRSALTAHPEIKAADANFRALVYDLKQRGKDFRPTVTFFGEGRAEYVDDPTSLSPSDNGKTKPNFKAGLVAELTLFDGFERENDVYASAARVDQGVFELLDASESMALGVAEAYINVARRQHLLRVASQTLVRYREIEARAQEMVKGGSLPVSDIRLIESRIVSARTTIVDAERALLEAGIRYKALVGRPAAAKLSIPKPVKVASSMKRLVAASLQNNYRIKRAQRRVVERRFEASAADGEFRPQISLNGGVSTSINQGGVTGQEDNAFVGLSLNWQLYGASRDDVRGSQMERTNQALYQLHSTAIDVEVLASLAWTTYKKSLERRILTSLQIGINESLVDLYEQEFELATRTLLDLLTVEAGLSTARADRINAESILTFSAYRALASQSSLAKHFGVSQSNRVLADSFTGDAAPNPRKLIQEGATLLEK